MTADARLELSGTIIRVLQVLEPTDTDFLEEFLDSNQRQFLDSGSMTIDFSATSGIDTVPGVVIHEFLERMRSSGVSVSIRGASDEIQTLFSSLERSRILVHADRESRAGFREYFEGVGEDVFELQRATRDLGSFLLDAVYALADLVIHPLRVRWSMVLYYMQEAGVKAIPIIAVLTWLLGVVLGYQAGYQMKMFGAETFMPALLAYSITWEIGPMLAAVLVAGRSGSAFAAEIGTMQVRQEVDALRVMGFDTFSYLVTPKMVALLCVMPLLVLLANFSGVIGGLLAGTMFLDLPASTYISELGKALIPLDIIWGMIKSVIYAVIISNVGCFMGIRVKGGASAVGKATTSAVVVSIFMVILADALLSLLFVHIRPGLSF